MPRIMVAKKSVFSNPLRVWNPELKLSAPKAPPKDAPVCCKRIVMIRSTDSAICTYGKILWRATMCRKLTIERFGNQMHADKKEPPVS